MKIKIFNTALFAVISVMAVSQAFAQQRTDSVRKLVVVPKGSLAQVQPLNGSFNFYNEPMVLDLNTMQDTTYRKEYKKLQEQMNELRTKMNKMRTDEIRKNSETMRERNRVNIDKSFELLKGFSYSYENNVSGASKGLGVASGGGNFYYNGNRGDDYIKKKVASGEAKEKTKSYTKSYPLDNNDKIQVENSYGKVTVVTWPKNEVKVDVEIKADADDDAAAQKLLDGVTISDNKTGSAVYFKTNIDSYNNHSWSNDHSVQKTEVNYTVYMPAKSPLMITNRFGSIKMPDLSGKINLNLSYGNLTAQQLTNPLNEITVKFGDASIETLNSQSVNISYGKMNIGTADNLNARLSFSSGNVNKLRSAGDISVKYGAGFKVGQLYNVKNLNVDASFTKVLVNVKEDYNFDVNTTNGNFSYDDNGAVKVLDISPAGNRTFGTAKSYKGKVGKGNADKNITIKSTYGNVKFDEL